MGTPASFDLNQAIQQWRQQLAASTAIRKEDVDELESHLRDAVVAMEAKGLTSDEAFWVARHRLGSGEMLQSEFGKVNTSQVWIDRALWMVIGFIGIGTFSSAIRQLSLLVGFGLHQWTSIGLSLGSTNTLAFLIALSLAVLAFRRSGKRTRASLGRLSCWARAHPVLAALLISALEVLQIGASRAIYSVMRSTLPHEKYFALLGSPLPAAIFQMLLWPVLLGLLLAKAHRHSSPLSNA